MPGGNLIRKRNQVLINALTSGDVAVNSGVISIKQYGEIKVSNISSVVKVDHLAATKKVSRVRCYPVYPVADTEGYECGIKIQRDYNFGGDPQSFMGHSKAYTHKIDNLKAVASGYLNVADRAEICGYVSEMIADDPTAIVDATAVYYLAYTASGTVAVTDLRGNVVLAETTYSNCANAAAGLLALDGITAVVDSTDGVYVTASEGLIFTLQGTKWTLGDSYVELTQSEDRYPYSTYLINGFGTESITTAFVKEILPLTRIQQLFAILPVSGIGSTPNIPIAATDYSKVTFHITHEDAAGLVGGSRTESFEEIVDFFIPTTVVEGAYWSDVIYPTLEAAGLTTTVLGGTTMACTGVTTAGIGTMSVVDAPGFVVSSVNYYAGAANTGTIHLTTGLIASGTDADIFYAEIKYAHLDYLVVSKMTCTTFVNAGVTFLGTRLTLAEIAHATTPYEFLGRWDITASHVGIGTPVLRDFNIAVEQMVWTYSGTLVCSVVTGEITTAATNTDVQAGLIKYAGVTGTVDWDVTWTTGNLIDCSHVAIPV